MKSNLSALRSSHTAWKLHINHLLTLVTRDQRELVGVNVLGHTLETAY